MGDAMPGKHFRPGTAHPYKINPCGTCIFGRLYQGGVVDGVQHRLKEVRFMAMDNDIDLVLLQTAHIDFAVYRHRRAE